MKTGRFFGTTVLVLFTILAVSCKGNQPSQKRGDTMRAAMQVAAELVLRYQMQIQNNEGRDHSGQKVNTETRAQDYNWRRFSLAGRNEVKGKLNRYVSLLSEALALDAQKGIYLTMRETVIGWRDSAMAYQRSLERFEKTFGESYEPKSDGPLQPIYNRSLEASAEVR